MSTNSENSSLIFHDTYNNNILQSNHKNHQSCITDDWIEVDVDDLDYEILSNNGDENISIPSNFNSMFFQHQNLSLEKSSFSLDEIPDKFDLKEIKLNRKKFSLIYSPIYFYVNSPTMSLSFSSSLSSTISLSSLSFPSQSTSPSYFSFIFNFNFFFLFLD
jgi:hypothetical protein